MWIISASVHDFAMNWLSREKKKIAPDAPLSETPTFSISISWKTLRKSTKSNNSVTLGRQHLNCDVVVFQKKFQGDILQKLPDGTFQVRNILSSCDS
jgi:hypothetical protein